MPGALGSATTSVASIASTDVHVSPLLVERLRPSRLAASSVVPAAEPAVARSITMRPIVVPMPLPSMNASCPTRDHVTPPSVERSTPQP